MSFTTYKDFIFMIKYLDVDSEYSKVFSANEWVNSKYDDKFVFSNINKYRISFTFHLFAKSKVVFSTIWVLGHIHLNLCSFVHTFGKVNDQVISLVIANKRRCTLISCRFLHNFIVSLKAFLTTIYSLDSTFLM
jgi:hypothetical protein